MFNTNLLLILVGISIPGILLLIATLKTLYYQLKQKNKRKKFPSFAVFIISSLIQSIAFVLIASSVGILLSNNVGLNAPFLEMLSTGKFSGDQLSHQIYSGTLLGFSGSIIFLLIYYGVVQRWLDTYTFKKIGDLRNSVGLTGRIFYGGIVEEILFRWGVMTVLLWIGLKFSLLYNVALWFSIVITGLLFGICHLPSYLASGCKKSSRFIVSIISLNLYASIIFGWAYAQYGLCSAIIAHSVFHCVWYPFDKLYLKQKKCVKARDSDPAKIDL